MNCFGFNMYSAYTKKRFSKGVKSGEIIGTASGTPAAESLSAAVPSEPPTARSAPETREASQNQNSARSRSARTPAGKIRSPAATDQPCTRRRL